MQAAVTTVIRVGVVPIFRAAQAHYNLLMPCRYVIDKERRLVISAGWDCVTTEELKAHRAQLAKDPEFDPDFDQLVDGTAVTNLEISMAEAKVFASQSVFSPRSRRAFVASNLLILGLARLMETYARMGKGREQVSVFHDRATALKWLGLENLP